MYKLYWSPGSAGMTPHAMLEDIGVPYELIRVDTSRGEQRSPDYLKINPHARVPTLVYDGDKILYEATAISLFLAERHPGAGLAPAPTHADRAPFGFLDAHLARSGPHLCGAKFYACDYYAAMLARWTRDMSTPAQTYPHVRALIRAAMARPGYARMLEAEGIAQAS
jgi:glutathione S-transferase